MHQKSALTTAQCRLHCLASTIDYGHLSMHEELIHQAIAKLKIAFRAKYQYQHLAATSIVISDSVIRPNWKHLTPSSLTEQHHHQMNIHFIKTPYKRANLSQETFFINVATGVHMKVHDKQHQQLTPISADLNISPPKRSSTHQQLWPTQTH